MGSELLTQRNEVLDRFLRHHGIIDRKTWGARPSKCSDANPSDLDWDYNTVVIHHLGRWIADNPVSVQSSHMDKNGWDDVGYHFMVNKGGQVYEGRRLVFKGANVEGANTGKIGVLVMGHFEKEYLIFGETPSKQHLAGTIRIVTALKSLFPTLSKLGGHRDYKKKTECPGNQLYPLLDGIRSETALAPP